MIQERESLAIKVLDSLDVDLTELKFKIEEIIQQVKAESTNLNVGNIPLNKQAEKVLKVTFLEAKLFKNDEINPEHLLLSILKHNENTASDILSEFDIDYEGYKAELEYVRQEQESNYEIFGSSSPEGEIPMEDDESKESYGRRTAGKSKTPVLDNFGRDVTRLAEENKLCLLYTSPSPRDATLSRMPSSA